ncbi:hypothetical protein JTB14_008514, partial [Gonioctena quinquepunctata]
FKRILLKTESNNWNGITILASTTVWGPPTVISSKSSTTRCRAAVPKYTPGSLKTWTDAS